MHVHACNNYLNNVCCIQVLKYPYIPVRYRVTYNESDRASCPLAGNTRSPGDVILFVPQGTNGIQLMEAAVARSDRYRFSATFRNAGLGYFIYSINGTRSDFKNSCFWTLSFRPYLSRKFVISPVGISSYYPSYKAVVQWQYRKFGHK